MNQDAFLKTLLDARLRLCAGLWDSHAVEDIFQITLLRAVNEVPNLRDADHALAWSRVTADHRAVASIGRGEMLASVKRGQPVVAWSSGLGQGATAMEGEWLPATAEDPARLRALPRLLSEPGGPLTLYCVSWQIPWQGLETLGIKPETRVRLSGRMSASSPVEIMLNTNALRGGIAGSFFHRLTLAAGSWQIEMPVLDFRKDAGAPGVASPAGLQLRHIIIGAIGTDAGIEIEKAAVVHVPAP